MTTFVKDNKAIILLNDEVTVENSKEITDFIYGASFLDEVTEIFVSINSPGGSVLGGFNIFSALINSDKRVVTRIDGIAASIAAIIFFAGQEREMVDFGLFMIHDPMGGDNGALTKIKESLMKILGEDNFNNLSKLMKDETWLNVDEMEELKLIDKKIEINKGDMKETPITNKAMELFQVVNKMISEQYTNEMENTEKLNEEALESKVEDRVEESTEAVEEIQNETEEVAAEAEIQEEVETEEVEAEVEETVESEVEETEEESVEEPEAELAEVENKVEEVSNIADLTNRISELEKENEELKNSLSIYKQDEEKEDKLEILNKAGVDSRFHNAWMELDKEQIEKLTKTVNKKAPSISFKKDIKDISNMSEAEKMEFAKENPAEYAKMFRRK